MTRWYTPAEVAQRTGFQERTIQRWCRDELISHIRTPGGHYRLTEEHIREAQEVYTRKPRRPRVNVDEPNRTYRETNVVVPMKRPPAA